MNVNGIEICEWKEWSSSVQQKCWKNSRVLRLHLSQRGLWGRNKERLCCPKLTADFSIVEFSATLSAFFSFWNVLNPEYFIFFNSSLLQCVNLLADGQRCCLWHGHEHFGVPFYESTGTLDMAQSTITLVMGMTQCTMVKGNVSKSWYWSWHGQCWLPNVPWSHDHS
jgi:hypothetical protein